MPIWRPWAVRMPRFNNSAALPWVKGRDVVFTHTSWFAGISHDFAAASQNLDDIGTVAVSVTALATDEMKVRTPLQPEGLASSTRATTGSACPMRAS